MTEPGSCEPDAGGYNPAAYGDGHAQVYDRLYPAFPTELAVARIAALATEADGPVLELGIGTGRLGRPLRQAGLEVHGVDASLAMIAKLRSRCGGADIPVWAADLAAFDLPHHYSVIVCAVSTLFLLPDRKAQRACLRQSARHLAGGGAVVIEAFVPDTSRYGPDGNRVEIRHLDCASLHLVTSHHDPSTQSIAVTHVLADSHGSHSYPVTFHYAELPELDDMATQAGLRLAARTGGWDNRPYTATTRDCISVYRARRRSGHCPAPPAGIDPRHEAQEAPGQARHGQVRARAIGTPGR